MPGVVASVVEPVIGVLGDTRRRRLLIVSGGVVFAGSLLLFAGSPGFLALLIASVLMYPASGAFVSLSQATLMDLEPAHRERNMARWTAAGSLGVVAGSLAVAGCAVFHLGWRPVFAGCGLLMVPALVLAATHLRTHEHRGDGDGLLAGLRGALHELRRGEVLRWLTLLECADLLMDVLLGYLGLYFVAVAGATASQAALAVTIWTVVGLAGNLLLLPLLARVDGLRYLRISAAGALFVFPCLLLVPSLSLKFLLIGCLALLNAGWYPVLQARLYTELPERSGTAMAVGTIFGTGAALLPFLVGQVAQRAGLHAALWLLVIGPVVILLAIPRSPDTVDISRT